jgi:hypothetical protein
MSTEFRSLPVPLTDDELKLRADQLATRVKDKNAIEFEKKAANDGFKTRLQNVDGDLQELSTSVKTRQEHRPVECYWTENLKLYTMELLRSDTQQCVDTRPMTHAERQKSFQFSAEARALSDDVPATADAPAKNGKGKKAGLKVVEPAHPLDDGAA